LSGGIKQLLVAVAPAFMHCSVWAAAMLTEETSTPSETPGTAWIFDFPVDPQMAFFRPLPGDDFYVPSPRPSSASAAAVDEGFGFNDEQAVRDLLRSYMNAVPTPETVSNTQASPFGDSRAPMGMTPESSDSDLVAFPLSGRDNFTVMTGDEPASLTSSVKENLLATLPLIGDDPLLARPPEADLAGYRLGDIAARATAALAALHAALPREAIVAIGDEPSEKNPRAVVRRSSESPTSESRPQTAQLLGLGYDIVTYPGTLLIVLALIALQVLSREDGVRFRWARRRRRRRKNEVAKAATEASAPPEPAAASAQGASGRRRRRRSRSPVPVDR
jgi:hypothetical protein